MSMVVQFLKLYYLLQTKKDMNDINEGMKEKSFYRIEMSHTHRKSICDGVDQTILRYKN